MTGQLMASPRLPPTNHHQPPLPRQKKNCRDPGGNINEPPSSSHPSQQSVRWYNPQPYSAVTSLSLSVGWSDCQRDRHTRMNGEQRAGRTTTAKRGGGAPNRSDYEIEYDRYPDDHYNRVFDYQRVPSSVPVEPSPIKRPRPSSSSSSSSSSTAALRMKSSRASSRSNNTHTSSSGSSNSTKLKMAELLAIKRELTVIKVQIDGLLDCVDKMDRQRKDCS
ncbi:RNA-binding Raly-like protein isoform X2, partial [Lates japonicus]